MAKVITFSRTFPAYHPKKGQPTYFVEKFIKSRPDDIKDVLWQPKKSLAEQMLLAVDIWKELTPKHHTIRAGHRFKAGDYFSPRVWGNDINPKTGRSGPYHSKQIIIAPDTLIVKTWKFEINNDEADEPSFYIDNKFYCQIGDNYSHNIASNDGLEFQDLKDWFKYPKPFSGQIICWNDSINY